MTKKLIVVGAGPVGCLVAFSLAKMGWSVEIYEARPGIRPPPFTSPVFLYSHRKVNARYPLAFFAGSRPAAID